MLSMYGIYVTQNGLRDPGQLGRMVQFVKQGGIFDEQSLKLFQEKNPNIHKGPVIQIAEFEDGRRFVADGHHRMIAMCLAGREFLHESEYVIVKWKYEDYEAIHFESKWVTPFDPRHEIRFPDYLMFKKQVYEYLNNSQQAAARFIRHNKHQYAVGRTITDIPNMTGMYRFT